MSLALIRPLCVRNGKRPRSMIAGVTIRLFAVLAKPVAMKTHSPHTSIPAD